MPAAPTLFCSVAPFKKKFFYASPLMDSVDVINTFKCAITNLKTHFCQWQNPTNAHNPRK